LCGHATLASAYVLLKIIGLPVSTIYFDSLSGILKVDNEGDIFSMDFPSEPPSSCDNLKCLQESLGGSPIEALENVDYLAVYKTEEKVRNLTPDFSRLQGLDRRGIIVTAPSKQYDFVARFFAPKYGINEDPVTGSVYTQLIPYWGRRLNKLKLTAKQVSKRGGELGCELKNDRVVISGKARCYMKGNIYDIKHNVQRRESIFYMSKDGVMGWNTVALFISESALSSLTP